MKTAILGYGTVGSGVAKVLSANKSRITRYLGEELTLGYILDLRDFPDDPNGDKVVRDLDVILADKDVRVICETMGGLNPAYEMTKRALSLGVSVCTSNKELVATHGTELMRVAEENNCSYLFEASVGGGIPLLRPFSTTLMHERIDSVTGILNGTTNYILTQMEKGDSFDTALTRAQQKGYAEKDPSADIDGIDCGRKTAILASLASGGYVAPDTVHMEGIRSITTQDYDYAGNNGYVIKLLGRVVIAGGATGALAAPFFVPKTHPLADVSGVMNACIVHGNMLGDVMFYGPGAGSEATASAVVSDLLDAARHDHTHVFVHYHATPVMQMKQDEMYRRFFVRVDEAQKRNAIAAFGEDITFVEAKSVRGEWAFITGEVTEAFFADALGRLEEVRGYMRVLD